MAGLEITSPRGITLHRMNVDEFIAVCRSLPSEISNRLELWDGVVIEMPSEGALRMRLVQRAGLALTKLLLAQGLDDRLVLSAHGTTVLQPRFVLEPDVMVVPTLDGKHLPGPSDLELVVEIAVSSRDYDFGAKRAKYAEHGVRELWILDGEAQTLHRCRLPDADGYAETQQFKAGERIAPLFASGAEIAVADLF